MMKHAMVATLLSLLGTLAAQAQPAGATSTSSGVFTAEQAKSGERAYQSKCATCHGTDLHSDDTEAPDLTDRAFRVGWQNKTIAKQFEIIRKTMPLREGGSLDDQTYLDIIAYILQFNGIAAGN